MPQQLHLKDMPGFGVISTDDNFCQANRPVTPACVCNTSRRPISSVRRQPEESHVISDCWPKLHPEQHGGSVPLFPLTSVPPSLLRLPPSLLHLVPLVAPVPVRSRCFKTGACARFDAFVSVEGFGVGCRGRWLREGEAGPSGL